MDWFLYDNGLGHERVKNNFERLVLTVVDSTVSIKKIKEAEEIAPLWFPFN